MTLSYNIEYYMVCGLPVAAVRAPAHQGRVIQAWAADKERGVMRRDARLLSDIECDSRVRPMSKMAFDAYCAQNSIDQAIPEQAIRQTLFLVSGQDFTQTNYSKALNGFGMAIPAFR